MAFSDSFTLTSTLCNDRYAVLCEFFDSMVSAIRLLRLKRQPSTFANLSRNVECLTDRRFTLHHLAQLKRIVPEIIVVKKIRVQDEVTGCMKEDLHISLEVNALESEKNAKRRVRYSVLKGIFRSEIRNYATKHPKCDDVAEGELPELFYKPKEEPEESVNKTSVLRSKTLMGPSYRKRFSSRALSAPVSEPVSAKPLLETPVKNIASEKVESGVTPVKIVSTPTKSDSTPARLMVATPALRTPKRSRLSDDEAADLPNKSAKRRALKFDKEIDIQIRNSVVSKDLLDVLPENLLDSLMEKERRTLEEQDPIVLRAQKRQQLIAGLPKLFDMIQLLFQSIRRAVMTKDELIHKIITGHLDIVDKGEVEEQLKLLQEITPEFVTVKSCLSGDILVRLNKASCADQSIRAKLLEAK